MQDVRRNHVILGVAAHHVARKRRINVGSRCFGAGVDDLERNSEMFLDLSVAEIDRVVHRVAGLLDVFYICITNVLVAGENREDFSAIVKLWNVESFGGYGRFG